MPTFNIVSGSWESLKQDASYIRQQVFIDEQKISAQDEWDSHDAVSLHFVLYDQNQAVATARLLNNNSIGRVAVLKQYRGHGLGRVLMLQIIQQAKIDGRAWVKLSAQVHAIEFYQGLGFRLQGEEYLDCGILHIDMIQKLQ